MPPEVLVVQEDIRPVGPRKGTGQYDSKGTGAYAGKGKKDVIIEVIEDDRAGTPRRRPVSRTNRSKKKGKTYNSDSSQSDSASETESASSTGSESGSAYSDTETTVTSVTSDHLRRQDSGYDPKSPARKQHGKSFLTIEKQRRHSASVYVPDPPPRPRAPSYERSSLGAIGYDPVATEIFTAGIVAATKAAVAERIRAPSPRRIAYRDDQSQRSSLRSNARSQDEDILIHDEIRIREGLRRRENPRLVNEFGNREEYFMREEPRYRDMARGDFERRNDANRKDDFIPYEDIRLRNNLSLAEEDIRRNSAPFQRLSEAEFARTDPLRPLPLDPSRAFKYVRNPFEHSGNPFAPRHDRESGGIDKQERWR